MASPARGKVTINVEECKGCGVCVEACPPKCLELEADLSAFGVHPAHYRGEGCTGCGICFYVCPEPGAIVVYRIVIRADEGRRAEAKGQSTSAILDLGEAN